MKMEDHITDSLYQEPDDLIDDYEGKVQYAQYLADMARDDEITKAMDEEYEEWK